MDSSNIDYMKRGLGPLNELKKTNLWKLLWWLASIGFIKLNAIEVTNGDFYYFEYNSSEKRKFGEVLGLEKEILGKELDFEKEIGCDFILDPYDSLGSDGMEILFYSNNYEHDFIFDGNKWTHPTSKASSYQTTNFLRDLRTHSKFFDPNEMWSNHKENNENNENKKFELSDYDLDHFEISDDEVSSIDSIAKIISRFNKDDSMSLAKLFNGFVKLTEEPFFLEKIFLFKELMTMNDVINDVIVFIISEFILYV